MPNNEPQPLWSQFLYHLSMGLICQPKQVPLTPLRLATGHLETARLDLLEHAHLAEYHSGMVDMLETRIARLSTGIAKLSSQKEEQ